MRREIGLTAEADGEDTILRLPQDPGQAGKDQALQFEKLYARFKPVIRPVSGKKSVRARGFADAVNLGNVYVVTAPWNAYLVRCLRRFREDETDQEDDVIDALSDGYNELFPAPKLVRAKAGPSPAPRPGFRPGG